MRAHELLRAMNPDSPLYHLAMAAVKFDMGELDGAVALAEASSKTFFEIPAPICLFEIHDAGQLQWYLAQDVESMGGVLWFIFCKDGGMTSASKYALLVRRDGLVNYLHFDHLTFDISPIRKEEAIPGHEACMSAIGMANAVEVFSCCNVSTVEHTPPKFTNAKRISKGKIPFFTYRTLHITNDTATSEARSMATHASPRLHLRRGHIRRLPSDRRIWVRATLVGDKSKGFAAKEYSV